MGEVVPGERGERVPVGEDGASREGRGMVIPRALSGLVYRGGGVPSCELVMMRELSACTCFKIRI